jgi:hypothetical protein
MIDLSAAYDAGLARMHARNDRHDNEFVHIGGDMAGLCDRLGWARRRYASAALRWDVVTGTWVHPYPDLALALPASENIVAMQLGFKAEDLVLHAFMLGLPDDASLERNVPCALVMTDEGMQGKLFTQDDGHGAAIEYARTHKGVAIGHIDALVTQGNEIVVIDVKSTVWGYSYSSGWKPKYPPKESHILQVASYAWAVALAEPLDTVSAGLWEIDLGGKASRWLLVDWYDPRMRGQVEQRLCDALAYTHPESNGPPPVPNRWTMRDDGSSWACGSIKNGKVQKAYCPLLSCPSHVLSRQDAI